MSELLQSRLSRRAGLGLATAVFATAVTSRVVVADEGTPASTTDCSCETSPGQSATPAASPVAIDDLPPGPLGDRIQWLLDLINGDPAQITGEAIGAEFTPEVLEAASADELAAVIAEVATKAGPLTIQEGQIATTLEEPPSTAVFRVDGRDRVVVQITLSVDTSTGLISGLYFKPLGFTLDVPAAATPAS